MIMFKIPVKNYKAFKGFPRRFLRAKTAYYSSVAHRKDVRNIRRFYKWRARFIKTNQQDR